MVGLLQSIDIWVQRILRYIAITMFSILALLLIANISLRLINDLIQFLLVNGWEGTANFIQSVITINSFYWFDEIIELSFAALVFYGAAALWCAKLHFSVGDWITPRINSIHLQNLYKLLILLISATFMAILFWYSLKLTLRTNQVTTAFQIKQWILYSCVPISSMIMLIYSIVDVVIAAKRLLHGDHPVQQ
ncbi:TRAP transporter small permease subunit [Psychromonas sp. 14N.309.X.WAT.B.A12]|uniref:TRAP transporter small permease n=1 Tax=Psychromonas sp. 14N.309.X.WAT.B.A12 TaxID=2998322 RepID=UPI0025AF7BDB|nr:TRAP transporter small permease subunit [Psychromonas sp. 14N.309.X.WAT.B.A12]MDN2664272.1 TRAP transporter small permease subunit [Psychromonas sp. 14N.309.X.WAT.B.A12]